MHILTGTAYSLYRVRIKHGNGLIGLFNVHYYVVYTAGINIQEILWFKSHSDHGGGDTLLAQARKHFWPVLLRAMSFFHHLGFPNIHQYLAHYKTTDVVSGTV